MNSHTTADLAICVKAPSYEWRDKLTNRQPIQQQGALALYTTMVNGIICTAERGYYCYDITLWYDCVTSAVRYDAPCTITDSRSLLTAIFPLEPGLVGSTGAKDDGGGGDNCSYNTCKAPVKSSPATNQQPIFYRPDALPVNQPTVSKHWMENITFHRLAYPKLTGRFVSDH